MSSQNILLPTSDIEMLIEGVYTETVGHCFPAKITNIISSMVDAYNYGGEVTDAAFRILKEDWIDNAHDASDSIVEEFERVIGLVVGPEHVATLEYCPRGQGIMVQRVIRPPKGVGVVMREQYQEHIDRDDYLPERVRKAYEVLLEESGVL